MSNISYRPRSERLAHGARIAEQMRASESLRASVRFERPAFNRPGWEAAAYGVLIGFGVLILGAL